MKNTSNVHPMPRRLIVPSATLYDMEVPLRDAVNFADALVLAVGGMDQVACAGRDADQAEQAALLTIAYEVACKAHEALEIWERAHAEGAVLVENRVAGGYEG
jgi:hypothetical protein